MKQPDSGMWQRNEDPFSMMKFQFHNNPSSELSSLAFKRLEDQSPLKALQPMKIPSVFILKAQSAITSKNVSIKPRVPDLIEPPLVTQYSLVATAQNPMPANSNQQVTSLTSLFFSSGSQVETAGFKIDQSN